MKNVSFVKRVLGRGLMVAGLGIALLVVGVPQVQAQNPQSEDINLRFDVTNLLCGIDGNDFVVNAISSTDACVETDSSNQVGERCPEALQNILSRGFGISAGGGGGVAAGISEALITTAAGITYTLTRTNLTRRSRCEVD
jgi:hypothetical protein